MFSKPMYHCLFRVKNKNTYLFLIKIDFTQKTAESIFYVQSLIFYIIDYSFHCPFLHCVTTFTPYDMAIKNPFNYLEKSTRN